MDATLSDGISFSRMMIWCSVGRDVDNGIWAMLGARMGIHDLYTGKIRNTVINDYKWFAERWKVIKDMHPDRECQTLADMLLSDLSMYLTEMNQFDSEWLKSIWMNPVRQGLMR